MTDCSPTHETFLADILIVDDSPETLRLLSGLLRAAGYSTRQAINSRLALQAIKLQVPDLVLMDIQMPDISGYQLCQHIKHHELTRNVPVVFLSGCVDAADKVRAFEVGGVDYITKPFHIEEVLVRVRNQLIIQKQQRQLMEQNACLQMAIQRYQAAEATLQHMNDELRRLSVVDDLTQIANRRHFNQHLNHIWRQSLQTQQPMSLVLCDVDYFKCYNDTYGHQQGDQCLQQLAQVLYTTATRKDDLVARYGGEEFALILPNTDADAVVYIVQMIQRAVAQMAIPHARSDIGPVITLSFGIASLVPRTDQSPEELIRSADTALYCAKAKGRNRFCQAVVQFTIEN